MKILSYARHALPSAAACGAGARADYQATLDTPGGGRPIDTWAKDQAKKALNRLGKESGN